MTGVTRKAAARTLRRPPAPDVSELHRRWLELVETDGPFLAVPVIKRVWPQGMPSIASAAKDSLAAARPAFEAAWERWDRERDDGAEEGYVVARDQWVTAVLRDVVGWGESLSTDPAALGVPITATSPDRQVSVAATGGLLRADNMGGDSVGALVLTVPPCSSLHDLIEDGWAASAIDRMEAVLRASSVPIGLVTDGRWWGLVCARPGAMVASGIVDALTWAEEASARDAFLTLIARLRLIGGQPQDRLPELFKESVAAAEEITEALGSQVRLAVELLVSAFSEAAGDARRRGEPSPLPAHTAQVYEAAVTVMMRVVFLLFAEERSLLPQGQLFSSGYGISGELDALDVRTREEGIEALDATHLSWHRLLATSQALYAGASFEDIRIPSYGGSLFDPSRFVFLLGRTARGTLAVTINDRVMLAVLRAVQVAELKGQPARRISFRDIDVEQIGYIYEGLLGYTSAEVDEVTVGLIGTKGAEPEIPLRDLEAFADFSPERLAEAILAEVKATQPAAKPPSRPALLKALRSADLIDDAERALLAVTTDTELRDRLRPFLGVIRRDLRGRPVVIEPGGLVVEETPSRASAGAHYTPRALAEEVVLHALEPLVYSPGPHQTADRDQWQRISSDAILDLKVADIACGSGAFLVAAARYLAGKLVEAWQAEGVARGEAHQLRIDAIREVVASCLYGADINGMAVEMGKLSLWLVSLDPKLPFSFVDDKVLHGNSLLGLTDERQLKALHIDPDHLRPQGGLFDLDVDETLRKAVNLRQKLIGRVDDHDPMRSAVTKRRLLGDYEKLTGQLSIVADGIIAAGLALGGKPGKKLEEAYENLRIALELACPLEGVGDSTMLDGIIARGMTPTVATDYASWKPLHWILEVPDVMSRGGFDAVVGNPPFLGGQKLTGAMGTNVRDWLVNALAAGHRGSADLVAYFLLRAYSLLTRRGNLGLVATNTLAQGDTRQVGLDRLAETGFTITRAIQSRSWPSASANLEFAAVWGTRGAVREAAERVSDNTVVARISTLLEPAGRVDGHPIRLAENQGIAFQGCIVLGMGFVLEPEEAQQWIADDPRHAEVLSPYLNGEDLNSRPDGSPSRWVIDFNDRTEAQAATYAEPFERLRRLVKPERLAKLKAVRSAPWWLFLRARPAMRKAIADLDEVLVLTRVSRTMMPVRVTTEQVINGRMVIFATPSFSAQAVLSSSAHWAWGVRHSTTMRSDPSYAPSGAFDTFPRPEPSSQLDDLGKILDTERREIMLRRNLGLTKLYNLINDPEISNSDADVARMRKIHVDLDQAVMAAYGWDDVKLDHGFHTYRQMQRWTVSPAARVEILDRLLAENRRRAALQGAAPAATDEPEEEELGDE